MVKKLIKYDLLKMLNTLPYFFVATIFFAGLTRLINIWNDIQFMFILGQIFQGTTIALIVNSLVNAFIGILILSFRFNFYSDESYLTHTLPVSKNQLYLSKFISAVITLLSTVVVIFVSLVIMFYSSETVKFIEEALSLVLTGLNFSPIVLVILVAITVLFQLLTMILIGFASIVKGHSYNNGKVIKSFMWFAIFYVLSSIVSLIGVVIALLVSGNISEIFATTMKVETFVILIVTALIIYACYVVAFYFIGNKLFNKGVNVD